MGRSNKQRLSLREGGVFVDGLKVLDAVTASVVFKPTVAESQAIGSKTKDRRWLGYDVTGALTEYRATPWLKDMIKKYKETGETPEFTLQGIQNDKGSDYNKTYGDETVTVVGCVITGDINLLELDVSGEHTKDNITFGGKDVVI